MLLTLAAALLVAPDAYAIGCEDPSRDRTFALSAPGIDKLPLNAHLFVWAGGTSDPTVRLRVTSMALPLTTRPLPLGQGRVLEIIPAAPLAPGTDHHLELGPNVEPSRFATGDAADLVPPALPVDFATQGPRRSTRCDSGTQLTLTPTDGRPLDAAFALVWLPDPGDRLRLDGPPDLFVPLEGTTLRLEDPLDTPTRVAVQLVDGAGSRSPRREIAVVGTMTMRKRLRVFRYRLSRVAEEQRTGFTLAVLIVASAGFLSLRTRRRA